MPKLICRQCDFSTIVSPKMARFGMMCPECHCGNLKQADNRRRLGGSDVAIHPAAIRACIGGIVLIAVGVVTLMFGLANWNAGRLGARVVGAGAVLVIVGLVSLAVGSFGILRDMIRK